MTPSNKLDSESEWTKLGSELKDSSELSKAELQRVVFIFTSFFLYPFDSVSFMVLEFWVWVEMGLDCTWDGTDEEVC